MLDKTQLGSRFTCFECGTKFYDLNRDPSTCPECQVDQADAPVRDMKTLLTKGGGRKKKVAEVEEEKPVKAPADESGDDDGEEEEEEEGIGLLGDDDDLE